MSNNNGSKRRCWFVGDRQHEALKRSAQAVDLTGSELLRRMLDYCCRPVVLGELVPAMSGRIVIGEK